MLGPAPVLDFDGTIAVLPVDWAELRQRLGVQYIDDLWTLGADAWVKVTEAEVEAAARAHPVVRTIAALEDVSVFAVLTSNSEGAVEEFFRRFANLADKLAVIVGRETMGGSKRDRSRFQSALGVCATATARARGDGPLVYVGDAPYELELAEGVGAHAVDVRQLTS